MKDGYTNSMLTTHRRCPRERELRYDFKLEPEREERSEALDVGSAWHKAHDGSVDTAMGRIAKYAPNELWQEKIARLFYGHLWYWSEADKELEVVETESTFDVMIGSWRFRGQRDGILRRKSDGARGLLERKTTSDGLDGDSPYWDKLRLDTQLGIYSSSESFDFIVYDVVRKPTISPKRILKRDAQRMIIEAKTHGHATYYGEVFPADEVEQAIINEKESVKMYGARLTADIGDRPSYYFARREVPRMTKDIASMHGDIIHQVDQINVGTNFRNPDSCNAFGRRCAFFGLCSNNVHPTADEVPDGFRRRAVTHPELEPEPEGD